jgi:hypothetical protein
MLLEMQKHFQRRLVNQDLWWLAADFHHINETLTKAFGAR